MDALDLESFTVKSELMKEARAYDIILPKTYRQASSKDKHYPVLYLLDGQFLASLINGLLDFTIIAQQTPEMIVVAINSPDRGKDFTPTDSKIGVAGTVDKMYEYSGGADHLLAFLQQELIPDIDQRYRTNADRTLAGYSLSGLFSLYALLKAPTTFNRTIAVDPSLWWDEGYLLTYANQQTENKPQADQTGAVCQTRAVYLCAGNTPSLARNKMHENAKTFYERLQTTPSRYHANFDYFEQETHDTIAVIGFYRGLQSVFKTQDKKQ